MYSMKTIGEVREFFQADVYATGTTGIEILYAKPGHSVVTLRPDKRHYNAVGQVMGAVYSTMADFAFAVAANYEFDGPVVTVTLDSHISFLSPMKGSVLLAAANVIKDGRGSCFYQIEVKDDLDTKIAEITATGYKISRG